MNQRQRHQRQLIELTSLPTAAGCEQHVIAWVQHWAARRRNVQLRRDRHGNLMLSQKGLRSPRPIIFEAHLDHPAFVLTHARGRDVRAQFRGGVETSYFQNARVALIDQHGQRCLGRIVGTPSDRERSGVRNVHARFDHPLAAAPGTIMRWDLSDAFTRNGRLHAPACDDLAAVAAALAAFEQILRSNAARQRQGKPVPDVRVLLTRAEEVGLVGAIAACKARFVPKKARIFALENSRSFAESPIGGGPIARVGDRMSVFDAELTYQAVALAERIAQRDADFRFQRKLMPGGVCEATAFQALGYQTTCLCLPLGNYHNMNEQTGRVDHEIISLDDFHALIRWLVAIGRGLDQPDRAPRLPQRLNELYQQRQWVLSP